MKPDFKSGFKMKVEGIKTASPGVVLQILEPCSGHLLSCSTLAGAVQSKVSHSKFPDLAFMQDLKTCLSSSLASPRLLFCRGHTLRPQ